MITVIVKWVTNSENFDYLKHMAVKLANISQINERGCISYTVHRDLDRPNTIILHECYISDKALEEHKASDHYMLYVEKLASVCIEPPTVFRIKKTGR